MSESTSRTEHVSLIADYNVRHFNKKLGVDTTTRTGPSVYYKQANTVNGIKLPNWQAIIKAGNNATTGLTGTKYDLPASFATCGLEWSRFDGLAYEDYGDEYFGYPLYPDVSLLGASPPASLVTTVTNRCIRKFLDRAEAIRSSVEAGQDFGEYKETLHGMISPLSQLRKHVLSYFPKVKKLRRLYKDARSLTKALADTYLEWTFGWKPLVSDIAQAYVGLQNRSRFTDRQAIRVSATDSFQLLAPVARLLATISTARVWINSRVTGEYSVVMYGMIRTGAGTDGLVTRKQVLQLDLPHFVPTIWDLIPYSFIVDYFVNVGDIIRSLSVVDSVFMWGGQDTVTSTHADYGGVYLEYFAQPSYMRLQSSFAYGGNTRMTQRSIVRSVLVPAGLIPRVQFQLPLSSKPWENMGAIMASRLAPLVPLL